MVAFSILVRIGSEWGALGMGGCTRVVCSRSGDDEGGVGGGVGVGAHQCIGFVR